MDELLNGIYLDYDNYYDVEELEVHFAIAASDKLVEYADRVRADLGYIPFFNDFGGVDEDGYYDFYLHTTSTKVTEFYFIPTTNQGDDMKVYQIPMDNEFKKALFIRMNEFCIEELGGSIRDLIREARE